MTAPGASLAYAYDGSLLLSEIWSGGASGAVAWTYDRDFRITTETVRSGHGVSFGYDNDGLLMSAGGTTYTRFPATGLLQSSTVGSVATTFGYNGFGEPTSHATTVGGAPAYAATLGRDAGGRISQQAEVLGGVTTSDVYGYDANGNRNAVTTAGGAIAATFDAQDRIQTFGTRTYTHTPHGDVAGWTDSATATTTTLTYDVQGNLRTFQQPGTTVTYTVDGRNRRIGTAVNGVPVQGFLWQGQLRPVAELDGSENLVSRFVYGTRINVPEYMEKNGTTYRLVTDHLGSVRLVVDTTSNAVVQALAYDPWGVVLTDTNPGFQPFGYAGGLYDHRTGLIRFGVRDYDATIGRWLAKDPIGFGGGDASLYSYAAGSPTELVDPTGLDVRVYYEYIVGTSPSYLFAMLFEARHAFIVVTVPGQAWRLERTGSGELTETPFNPKDVGHFTARATVGSGGVCWMPNGFESAILAEFDRLQSSPNLPTYFNDPRRRDYNNSNTFASHLI